ncbi:MAG TPA: hypothetical protein VJU14_02150 [Solirubrobacterales bacterium]|nr:hypothetical protein [Solirubrobacterales bacterium]
MFEFLAAAKPVVVQVQEASGGASTESILVFIGGVLAAIAAVTAALITTRGASSRMEQQLTNERERFDRQLAVEAGRFADQLEHERYLARRAEASDSIEKTSRLIAQTMSSLSDLLREVFAGSEKEEHHKLGANLDQIREETNVIALRFGVGSPVVSRILEVVEAAAKSLPDSHELPLSDERKKELKAAREKVGEANAAFLREAEQALRAY